MVDMDKEIVFRDGMTLDGDPLDDQVKARACEVIFRGYDFGLTLDQFYWDNEMIYFEWRGSKSAVVGFYRYCSSHTYNESEEKRNAVIQKILDK